MALWLYGELGAMRIPYGHGLTCHYTARFGLSLLKFVRANPNALYLMRGRRIRVQEEPMLRQLYNLTVAERAKSLSDFWSETVLRLLAGLTPEEVADLRHTAFKTDKIRALDQLSLETLLKQCGLSPEAIEMLAVAYFVS